MLCALLSPVTNGHGTKGIYFRGLLCELNEKTHVVRQRDKHLEAPNKPSPSTTMNADGERR